MYVSLVTPAIVIVLEKLLFPSDSKPVGTNGERLQSH
jgi:SSS family solute:Na+ symporter